MHEALILKSDTNRSRFVRKREEMKNRYSLEKLVLSVKHLTMFLKIVYQMFCGQKWWHIYFQTNMEKLKATV